MRFCWCVAFILLISVCSTSASAQEPELRWDPQWNRVSAPEWAILTGAGITAASIRLFGPNPEPNWRGGILFDEPLYLAVAPENKTVFEIYGNASHVAFFGGIAYRLVEDLAVVGAGMESWDVAWQMLGMDLEAISIIATILWIPQLLIARERPVLMNCDHPTRVANKCDDNPERNRSFWAGHPALTTAMAGLTCVHHSKLQIYGGGAGDKIACGAMIGAAVVTGIGRLVGGYHWASDVILGYIAGTAAWMIPTALHYGLGPGDDAETSAAALRSHQYNPYGWSTQ